ARSCAGVGSALVTIFTMMIVHAIGGNNERAGFRWYALIIAVLFVVFITITCIAIKEKSTVDMQSPSVGQMFKALVTNDQAMVIVIAIVLINTSIYVTSNLVIYFFKYDFGGTGWYNSYTLFNMFGGAIQILSMMVAYPMLRRKYTNIKIFYITLTSAIIGYVVLFGIAFINMSNVYILFIPAFFIFAANGVLQVLTTIFLANTVDYGELKNGRRDESVIFSMQTFVVKLASGIAAFVASLCLSINNLSKQDTTEAEQVIDFAKDVSASAKLGLRMTMTILLVIGLFIAIAIFAKKFILTEEKVQEIAEQLHK
ncbi:MAG: MFS transporter, partial [Lachnospiraceae bacterium]|nr:MFS transporter [Lachnospiraceae bacterium]